jgi:hypothetical protein
MTSGFRFSRSPLHPLTPSVFRASRWPPAPDSRPQLAFGEFCFFTSFASNRYIPPREIPSKNALVVHSDTLALEKTPSKTHFASTCFRDPNPGPSAEVRGQRSEFSFQRSAGPARAGHPLSTVHCQLSTINCACRASTVYRLLATFLFNFQRSILARRLGLLFPLTPSPAHPFSFCRPPTPGPRPRALRALGRFVISQSRRTPVIRCQLSIVNSQLL